MCISAQHVDSETLLRGIAEGAARHFGSIDRTPSSTIRLKVVDGKPHQIRQCNACKKLEGLVNGICAGCNRRLAKEFKERGNQ